MPPQPVGNGLNRRCCRENRRWAPARRPGRRSRQAEAVSRRPPASLSSPPRRRGPIPDSRGRRSRRRTGSTADAAARTGDGPRLGGRGDGRGRRRLFPAAPRLPFRRPREGAHPGLPRPPQPAQNRLNRRSCREGRGDGRGRRRGVSRRPRLPFRRPREGGGPSRTPEAAAAGGDTNRTSPPAPTVTPALFRASISAAATPREMPGTSPGMTERA